MKIALIVIGSIIGLLFFLFLVAYVVNEICEKRRHEKWEREYALYKIEVARKNREIYETRRTRIFVKSSIPVRMSRENIYYYEPAYDAEVNAFLQNCRKKYRHYYTDYYLNYYSERIASSLEMIRYNHPDLPDNFIDQLPLDRAENVSAFLSPYIVLGEDQRPLEPCLIRVLDEEPLEYNGESVYRCSYCSLRPTEHYSTEDIFDWYFENVGDDPGVRYSIAHDAFSVEIDKLKEEILKRMDRLRELGMDEEFLRQLALPKVELSPIHVTKDYRIILPGFNNKEIKMEPVQRALYVLFLRHPEGILFKHLADYRKELMDIYSAVSNRSDKQQMEKTVARLTDPTDNSINEKCARIREAFVKEFSDDYARQYYIFGHVMEIKKIAIAEQEGMVVFE